MSIDLRFALRSALDVTAPPLPLAEVQRRAVAQTVREHRRRVRSMLAAASLIVVAALFAGGASAAQAAAQHVASVPAPAPIPQAT